MKRRFFGKCSVSAMGLLALLSIFAIPATSWAWSSSNTQVQQVLTFSDGHVVVSFSGWVGNNACGSSYFSVGLPGSPQAQQLAPQVLTAKLSGASLSVTTSAGSCDGNQERIATFQFN